MSKKIILVLAQILTFVVVFMMFVCLSSGTIIRPNEIGVMDNSSTGTISLLKPGFHVWPFEKGWTMFSTKVTVFTTELHRVCVENVRLMPLVDACDANFTYKLNVCSNVATNPNTVIYLYNRFNDYYIYSDLGVEESALAYATLKATTLIPPDFYKDRGRVEKGIESVLNFEMDSDPEPMMWIESVSIENIYITELN